MRVYFNNFFTAAEKKLIRQFLAGADLQLKNGWNLAVDVSDAIGRTASVDVWK